MQGRARHDRSLSRGSPRRAKRSWASRSRPRTNRRREASQIAKANIPRSSENIPGLVFEEVTTKQGWGIGLTLVKGIVEAHAGVVKAESYAKEGTTFTVDLPAAAEAVS